LTGVEPLAVSWSPARRKKRAEQARNYPFHRVSENKSALRKSPSALCALFDGLLISAGVHFKKDRQKYRQPIRPLAPETA
jgi:hypothetical protein